LAAVVRLLFLYFRALIDFVITATAFTVHLVSLLPSFLLSLLLPQQGCSLSGLLGNPHRFRQDASIGCHSFLFCAQPRLTPITLRASNWMFAWSAQSFCIGIVGISWFVLW
jgi:hypothetical protein